MKQKILILIVLALAATVLFFSKQDYHASQQQRSNVKAQLADAQARIDAANAANSWTIKKYNSLLEQCQIGFNAYSQLTVAQKAKLAAPDCGLSIVQ